MFNIFKTNEYTKNSHYSTKKPTRPWNVTPRSNWYTFILKNLYSKYSTLKSFNVHSNLLKTLKFILCQVLRSQIRSTHHVIEFLAAAKQTRAVLNTKRTLLSKDNKDGFPWEFPPATCAFLAPLGRLVGVDSTLVEDESPMFSGMLDPGIVKIGKFRYRWKLLLQVNSMDKIYIILFLM